MLRAMPDARRQIPPAKAEPVLRVATPVPQPPAETAARVTEQVAEELALCRRVAEGDEAAFESIVVLYQDRVFSFCLRLLGDRAEAEDVAQDVFLTVYRSAHDFRGESTFSTWLLRIAKNQSLNRIKYLDRRGRSGRRSLDEIGEERLSNVSAERAADPSPDELIEGGERAALVQQEIAALDPQHRAVLVLRDVEDMSYEEISGVTGLPIGTVKSRIHRGRSVLAARLARFFR
jgi:RNA polymerase sigma-70 factor, ECF subfamily